MSRLVRHAVSLIFCFVTCCLVPAVAGSAISAKQTQAAIESTSLRYFLEQAHPHTGLVRDQAENFSKTPDSNRVASLAATGFGLAVISNSATRGLVKPAFARAYCLRVLRFARDHIPRHKGWFLHWVDWESGARVWNSEYSTIDSALFLAGALYAAQIFPHTEIATIANQLYRQTDFNDMLTDGGHLPKKRTLSMAYAEADGYTKAQWDMYAEHMILLLLGLGHPTHPLAPQTWLAWSREPVQVPIEKLTMGLDQALFVHQYSQLFVDFRNFHDGFPNYHQNGRELTRLHRELASRTPACKTLQEGFWGFSAGLAPQDGYRVYSVLNHQSTVCIGCVAGSAMYMPNDILADSAKWLNGRYKRQVWGRYGFIDSLDLDQNWFSSRVLGITVGPEFLSLANTRESTSLWHEFMRIPAIQRALKAAETEQIRESQIAR